MSELISYRYNVTRLDSLEAFLEIRGSRGNGQPEVYFVRALGETADYGDRLLMLERKMNEKTAGGELFYLRLDGLPQMLRTEDGSSYSAIWEVCAAEKRLQGMKRIPENPELSRAIVNALFAAQEKFCAEKTGATQTIIRNFMAKILFWLDCAAFECFENWNAQKVIKVVGVNVTGLQEYLFFYFLTQLGCDVLLAEMEADVKGSEKLTGMSQDFRVGAFGNTKLSAYRREVQGQTAVQGTVAQAAASQSTVNTGAPLRVTIPPRPGRTPAGLNTAGQSGLTRGTPAQSAVTQGTVGQSMVAQTAAPQSSANTGAPLRVTIPPRPGRTPAAGSTVQNAGVQNGNVRPGNVQPGSAGTGGMQQRNQGMQSPAGGNTRTRTERTPVMPAVSGGAPAEKSFEELAQLASSIVMIAVQDDTGKVRGTGSGIMIGTEGFILTNFHVVCGGRAFAVRIEDDEQIYTTDEIIKYNTTMDLAVIRIQRKLKPLRIFKGERKLVRGQKVVAIGSPLGLFNSVSDGIISGFRQIHDTDMIQFTAPTSPGSSGGAVLNMQGEVIGISSAGFDDGQNINLAVGYESIRMFARGFYKE